MTWRRRLVRAGLGRTAVRPYGYGWAALCGRGLGAILAPL